jgi:hypothetical protein
MQVTWFNVSVEYYGTTDSDANPDVALGLTSFIIGFQITTTTGYTCMIGSNNTESIEWQEKTYFDSDEATYAKLYLESTTIAFNTTENEYVTDFHVYLARDISKEPWIDATSNDDDYDCKFIIAL